MSVELSPEKQSSTTTAPAISVVIASRNEERYIEACVRSMLEQDAPAGGIEVIVADGMSDDRTRDILASLAARDPRVIVIDNPERITPAGFNAGIRKARGQYIAILNAHSHVAPDYLVRCLEVAERTGADTVGGAPIADARTYVQRAVAASHHSPFSVGGASWHFTGYEGRAASVFSGFYKREVFDRIGLFDETLIRNNDQEFNFRLERSGGKIWQSPAIRLWYTPRPSLGRLFRQYQQFGYFKVLVLRKHGRVPALRHYVPALLVLGLTVPAVLAVLAAAASVAVPRLSVVAAIAAALFVLEAALYAIVLVFASVTAAARDGWSLLPILPATFATYHLSYGLGFLQGVVDFVLLRKRTHAPGMARINR